MTCCCCVYSRVMRIHERRALGAPLVLVSRSEAASTDSSGCREARRLRSRIVVVFVVWINASIATRTSWVPRPAALPGSAQLDS